MHTAVCMLLTARPCGGLGEIDSRREAEGKIHRVDPKFAI
jgi:hypothetical protein